MKPKSELILYQTEDNRTRIEVRLENETVWLTQAQLAELFQRERSVITKHIRNIFEEGEPVEKPVSANYAQTAAADGGQTVARFSCPGIPDNCRRWQIKPPKRTAKRKNERVRRKG
jgi:hypothetical protein